MKKPQRQTVVHLMDRHVAIVEASRRRDKIAIDRLALYPLEKPLRRCASPEERRARATEALREGARRCGAKLGDVALVMPQGEAKARFARLPATETAEIDQMARFEIEKAIPFGRETHVSDAVTLRRGGVEGSDVLMFAIDAPELDSATRAVDHAKARVETTFPSGWGLYSLYRRQAAKAIAERRESGGKGGVCHLVANLGLDNVELILARDGMPIVVRSPAFGLDKLLLKLREGFSPIVRLSSGVEINVVDFEPLDLRDFPVGQDDPAAPVPTAGAADPMISATMSSGIWTTLPSEEAVSAWAARLGQEIHRTLQFARTDFGFEKLDGGYLVGPGAATKGLAAHLSEKFGAPFLPLDPFGGMQPPREPGTVAPIRSTAPAAAPAAASPGKQEKAPAPVGVAATLSPVEAGLFADAIGATLELMEPEFESGPDLTPAWYRAQVATGAKQRSLGVTAAIVAGLLATAFLYFNLRLGHQENYMEQIREDNARMEPLAAQLADKEKKLEIVKRHVENKITPLALMDAINQLDVVRRKRVRFVKFEFLRGEELILGGHAIAYNDVNDLQDSLERNRAFFTRVDNRGQAPQSLSHDRNVISFELVCRLRSIAPGAEGGASRSSRRPLGGAPAGLARYGG